MNWNELQTPCYVIHKKELDAGILLLRQALEQNWNHYTAGYSFKTNALPWALLRIKEAGLCAEVVSEDEYDLAVYLGFSKIIYNGPVKGKRTFLHALRNGAIVNLDAERELDWLEESGLRDVTVGLRVNFDLEADCPGETSAGQDGGRFGFSYETGELRDAMERLDRMGVKLSGLHLHTSSKTRSVNIYRAQARKAVQISREHHRSLSYVDIGGGYFGGMDNKPKFPDYMKAIREELLAGFTPEQTMLIVEPGTSLITPPVEYISTVVDCKDTHAGRFVVTDGSRCDIDPLHGKRSYFHKVWYGGTPAWTDDAGVGVCPPERAPMEKQVICGFTCMENDRLFVMEDRAQLRPGDRIVYQKVGGYTMCLTPLFIRYFPAVYAEEDGAYTCVREHWGPEEYVAKSLPGNTGKRPDGNRTEDGYERDNDIDCELWHEE